jgi:hypothetical protein
MLKNNQLNHNLGNNLTPKACLKDSNPNKLK